MLDAFICAFSFASTAPFLALAWFYGRSQAAEMRELGTVFGCLGIAFLWVASINLAVLSGVPLQHVHALSALPARGLVGAAGWWLMIRTFRRIGAS